MRCGHVKRVLDAYIDAELSRADSDAVTAHLQSCDRCSESAEELRVVRELVRLCAARYTGPASLRSSMTSSRRMPRHRKMLTNAAYAAALALRPCRLVVVFALSVTFAIAIGVHMQRGPTDGGLATEVVSAHVRAMVTSQVAGIADGAVSNPQSWFLDRLHFVPRVTDSVSAGLQLVGWRTDFVAQQMVGVLMYMAGPHAVTIFVWPTHGGRRLPVAAGKMRGYNLVNWTSGGLFYCAVSDIDEGALYRIVLRVSGAA